MITRPSWSNLNNHFKE